MYWSTINKNPGVYISFMNGLNVRLLAALKVKLPVHISIDYHNYGR